MLQDQTKATLSTGATLLRLVYDKSGSEEAFNVKLQVQTAAEQIPEIAADIEANREEAEQYLAGQLGLC